jgi:hypothetical protein
MLLTKAFVEHSPKCVACKAVIAHLNREAEILIWLHDHRHFQSTSKLLQGLDGRNGVAILDTRYVATKHASALFYIVLAEFLLFMKLPQPFADNHNEILLFWLKQSKIGLKTDTNIFPRELDPLRVR